MNSSASTTNNFLTYDWSPLIQFETGGRKYYEKFLKFCTWPGGLSGITHGIGFDYGYMSSAEFEKFFAKYFNAQQANRLRKILGMTGQKAKAMLFLVRDIAMEWDVALEIFQKWTIPKFWHLAALTWPGFNRLHPLAQVALVSLIYNRGPSLEGSRRIEMKNIRKHVQEQNYEMIAQEIENMKKYWIGTNLSGLLKRREEEAKMVRQAGKMIMTKQI